MRFPGRFRSPIASSGRLRRTMCRVLGYGVNFVSLCHFAITRLRPAGAWFRLFQTVYGHAVGIPDSLLGASVRIKLYKHWCPVSLPPGTSMNLLLEVSRHRVYEPCTALVRSPLVVIDCGANIGVTSLYLADRFGADVTVHAFEPSSRNFLALTLNTRPLGRRIIANNAAVSDVSGRGTLQLDSNTEFHSLRPQMQEQWAGQESVRVMRLDEYFGDQQIQMAGLLKLDVEGAELEALRGLGERIVDVAQIVGELHLKAVDEAEFRSFLEGRGFAFTIRSRPAGHVAMFEAVRR